MKKISVLILALVGLISLYACSEHISQGNSKLSNSAESAQSYGMSSEKTGAEESVVQSSIAAVEPKDSVNSQQEMQESHGETASSLPDSAQSVYVAEETSEITFYDSIYDVPYAELEYEYLQEENGEYENTSFNLIKDGKPWISCPSYYRFGEKCFSDGHNFYIQALYYNDEGEVLDFYWFCRNFNHTDEHDIYQMDYGVTDDKLFIGARGDTLYTADGFEYTLHTMYWCQDGTCKR